MKTNNVGKIAIATSKEQRSPFNFSHDTNTTCGFGETQPLQCKLLVPGSKTTCSMESLVRLAPMVSPTFGRMKLKIWHQFVAMSDLTQNFADLMAQTSVQRGGNTFTPTRVLNVPLGQLSAYVLCGAKCSIYRRVTHDEVNGEDTYRMFASADEQIRAVFEALVNQGILNPPAVVPQFDSVGETCALNVRYIPNANGNGNLWSEDLLIPLVNYGQTSFGWGYDSDRFGDKVDEFVTMQSADLVIDDIKVGNDYYALTFRLSSFGKRLRKILIGCGYQVNLSSTANVSIMPLLAYYKAYFDLFGLCLYENYNVSNAAKLLANYDLTNAADQSAMAPLVRKFIVDLGSLWYTDEQDYVSAHIDRTAISPSMGLSSGFVDVPTGLTAEHIQEVSNNDAEQSTAYLNGHSYMKTAIHGALDEEYLKRLYKWTNRNTIAGKRIADLLRAQGLGDYVDRTKTNFIGYSEQIINVSDVVSNSDTFKDGTGSILGEYAGKGLSYDKTHDFTFENDEFGYWITLCAIVPEVGFAQSLDQTLYALDKPAMFNPEFDALGMAADRKSLICGSCDWSTGGHHMEETFGFIPRYSEFKVAKNIANGDILLRGVRDSYLPFILDRFIPLADRQVTNENDTGSLVRTKKGLPSDSLPVASLSWRYPTRYPWLGNLNRIFNNVGTEAESVYLLGTANTSAAELELYGNDYDNFIVHCIFNMRCYAPMKRLENSFETDDEGHTDSAIEKA